MFYNGLYDVDLTICNQQQPSALDAIPALVFLRGLLFSGSEPPKSNGLRKFYKPQIWKCLSDQREFETISASLVCEDPRYSTDTLLRTMIPFEKHFYERDHMDYSGEYFSAVRVQKMHFIY
jgi:hypothetical protein